MYDVNNIYEAFSIEEAVRLKVEHPDAKIIAGGSDVLIQIREGKLAGVDLISIQMIDELRGVSMLPDGSILIKPLTSFYEVTYNEIIERYLPTLGYAVDQVGGPQIRNIGTIGGNICNGVTSADSAATLKAYDAVLKITGPDGKRTMPYLDFSLGVGKVDLREGEILTGIIVPKESYERTYGHYIKYAMRKAMDIATMSCSANVRLSKDLKTVDRFRIAFGVAAPVPTRAVSAEAAVQGMPVGEALLDTVSKAVLQDLNPRSSWRAGKEFRLQLIKEMARRCTKEAITKAGGKI
ncbi:MAG: xanthine dehydrogenase subunit XdhB [Sphaerochaetaceae bacterium]|jgi:xanthine dehydrogenase FAD-binding subunit